MSPPLLEWYADPADAEPATRVDFGARRAGDPEVDGTLHLYNDRDGTGAATATGVRYTTYDDRELRESSTLVVERWLDVILADHDGTGEQAGPKRVGGSDPQHQLDLSGFPLASGAYYELAFTHVTTEDSERGLHQYVHAVHYQYT